MNHKRSPRSDLPNTPRVVDGIITDDKQKFIKIVGPDGSIWINVGDLHVQDAETRKRIFIATGCATLTAQANLALKDDIQAWGGYRHGIVASSAGWNGRVFVCGDGRILPSAYAQEVEDVTFTPAAKFVPKGTLSDWQLQAERFLSGQAIPLFACAVALSGPLLRFVPSDILNPQIEFVGAPKTAKSSVGIFAASVWAGDPEKSEGGGENWNMTPMIYDPLRRPHKDTFMLLDEAEGTSGSAKARADIAEFVVFSGASGGSKKRLTDVEAIPPIKMAMLSTTNTPIRDVLNGQRKERVDAIASRMMSLRITSSTKERDGLPVFETLPAGFESVGDATRTMRNAADRFYGTAGPAFAEAIAMEIRTSEQGFRDELHTLIEVARTRLSNKFPCNDERHVAFLAVIEVTAALAQRFGILRLEWGVPSEVVEKVLSRLEVAVDDRMRSVLDMRSQFFRYFDHERKSGRFFRLVDGLIPLIHDVKMKGAPQFQGMFTLNGRTPSTVYIDPTHFRATSEPTSSSLTSLNGKAG